MDHRDHSRDRRRYLQFLE